MKPQTSYLINAEIRDSPYFELNNIYQFSPPTKGFLADNPEIQVTPALITYKNKNIPVQISNHSNKTYKLKRNCIVGCINYCDDKINEVNSLDERQKKNKEMTEAEFLEGAVLPSGSEEEVKTFLLKNRGIVSFVYCFW